MHCRTPVLPVPHHLPVFPSLLSLSWWCHPAISSSDALFSFCPWSFLASGTFPMNCLCELLLLLMLSCFSHVRLCATPEMAAHQAYPSLEFSRQEHWSGLPFPSPMHESEKWKWSRSVLSGSSDPMDCSPPGSSVHGIFQAKSTGVGCHCLLRLCALDDRNTGVSVSASVLPVNIQGWSSLRLTSLISLLSRGLSGVFSSTRVWRLQFFGILHSLHSSSHNLTWSLGRPSPWLYGPLSAE